MRWKTSGDQESQRLAQALYLQVVCMWTSHLTLLGLGFIICKMNEWDKMIFTVLWRSKILN